MLVSDLPVNHKIISKLETKNISTLTEIQERTMLPAIQGKDIIASSKTGSGKTFAFLVPAINRLMSQKALSKQDPRALILAPTRELAKQVFIEAKSMCTGLNLTCSLIVGGENYNDQVKALRRNPHIIVGTAGRVADKCSFLKGLAAAHAAATQVVLLKIPIFKGLSCCTCGCTAGHVAENAKF